ncbi:MAG: sigma-54 dependent transcriptional regulator [bacterium]|nr:sigma-54 dependent transcriptional regulator [bacterium]
MARKVAESDVTVLIRGESGTGKGVFAQAIHAGSRRDEKPFAVVHCPSLPGDLIENELFGHAKGAFTGAVSSSAGRVAQCDGGTLFLDEIAELPMSLQPKLLRFVQDRQYERVGDPITRTADVRILAASNQDLESAIREGRFRADLFYRLNVIQIDIPPLRKHPQDILTLAEQFLAFFARKHNRRVLRFTPEACEAIQNHHWPGNVRELQNAIERAVILSNTDQISPGLFPFYTADPLWKPQPGEKATLAEIEKTHIHNVLATTTSLEEAAQVLGIDPSTLWRRRKHYGI